MCNSFHELYGASGAKDISSSAFQVMMWDSLNVNVSPSFAELQVSVGGVSVRSGHDSGWDPLSLSGRGFICICHVAASSRAII